MVNSVALSKFRNIKTRSFESYLELFLICNYITDESLDNTNLKQFVEFDYSDLRIELAINALQLSKSNDLFCEKSVVQLDKAIKNWTKKNNDLEEYKEFFAANRLICEEDFIDFYGEDNNGKRSCYFCGITEEEINKLIEKRKIETKRLSTRGKTMEIDRIEANNGYVKGNIVKCCYWCNNAKTDEFSAQEFKPIGMLIGSVLRNRLK